MPALIGTRRALFYNTPAVIAGGDSAEVAQFFARITDPGATRKGYYSTLIDGLVSDGLWSKIDCLYILAADIAGNAVINLKSSSFGLTAVNAPTFTADQGYTAASNKYLTSTFAPATAGGNFTQNSAAFGFYNRTSSTANDNSTLMGIQDSNMIVQNQGGVTYVDVNDANFPNVASTNHQGMWIATRNAASGAGAVNAYKNGNTTPFLTSSGASAALSSNAFWYLGDNDSGVIGRQGTGELAAAFISSGLNATEASNLAGRINAYMTSLGTNVY